MFNEWITDKHIYIIQDMIIVFDLVELTTSPKPNTFVGVQGLHRGAYKPYLGSIVLLHGVTPKDAQPLNVRGFKRL
jgi:hypothetical protein